MPTKSDEYTSFVTSARKIAISGGRIAHQVPKKRFSVRIVCRAFASFSLNDLSLWTLSAYASTYALAPFTSPSSAMTARLYAFVASPATTVTGMGAGPASFFASSANSMEQQAAVTAISISNVRFIPASP